jgi:hypothetical protein
VRYDDDGPWLLPGDAVDRRACTLEADRRDNLYSGLAGLALTLAEVRLDRQWSETEQRLADGIAERLSTVTLQRREPSYAFGVAGDVTALRLLAPGSEQVALERLRQLSTAQGWHSTFNDMFTTPFSDLLMGAAGIAMTALWAGGEDGLWLAQQGCDVLIGAAEHADGKMYWRPRPGAPVEVPNYSHGNAGICAALALASKAFDRPDWQAAAVSGTEHLLALADTADDGLRVPHYVPHGDRDEEQFTHSWCHGGTGTSYLFLALHAAGVDDVGGRGPLEWYERCLRSVRESGLPQRLRPGFWDNDGRCCGTAGVGDSFLDAVQFEGSSAALDDPMSFAAELAETLVARAQHNGAGLYWQFLEHRNDPSLLPPHPGFFQGAAGIAAFLFRAARVIHRGSRAPRVSRPDALPFLGATHRST